MDIHPHTYTSTSTHQTPHLYTHTRAHTDTLENTRTHVHMRFIHSYVSAYNRTCVCVCYYMHTFSATHACMCTGMHVIFSRSVPIFKKNCRRLSKTDQKGSLLKPTHGQWQMALANRKLTEDISCLEINFNHFSPSLKLTPTVHYRMY